MRPRRGIVTGADWACSQALDARLRRAKYLDLLRLRLEVLPSAALSASARAQPVVSSSCSQSGSASRARRPARRRPARRRRAAPRPRPRSNSRRGASDRTPSTTRSTSGCAGMFQSSNQTRFAFVAIDRFGSMGESDRFGSLSPIVYLRRTLQLGGQCLSPPSPRGMTIRDFAAPLAWPLPNHKVLTPTSYVLGDEARFAAFYVRHRRVAAGF